MTHYAERREFCWHKTANLEGAKSYFISDCPFIYYLSVSNYYPFDCVFACNKNYNQLNFYDKE